MVKYKFIFLIVLAIVSQNIFAQEKPAEKKTTAMYDRMAKQMAEWMDMVWEQVPEEGTANLKFLFTKDGEPYAGNLSIEGEFAFRSVGRINSTQAFNPNSNGRWVFEGINPGTYELIIEGKESYEGFKWSKKSVVIKAGETPLFEIELKK